MDNTEPSQESQKGAQHVPRKAYSTKDVHIKAWMYNAAGLGLPLRSCALILYARIFEVTQDGAGVFCQPMSSFADEFGFDRRVVAKAKGRLLDLGYIEFVRSADGAPLTVMRPGRPVHYLRAAELPAKQAQTTTYASPATRQRLDAAETPHEAVEAAAREQKENPCAKPGNEEAKRRFKAAWPRPDARDKSGERAAALDARLDELLARHDIEEIMDAVYRTIDDYVDAHADWFAEGSTVPEKDRFKYLPYASKFVSDPAKGLEHVIEQMRIAERAARSAARAKRKTAPEAVSPCAESNSVTGHDTESEDGPGRAQEAPAASMEETPAAERDAAASQTVDWKAVADSARLARVVDRDGKRMFCAYYKVPGDIFSGEKTIELDRCGDCTASQARAALLCILSSGTTPTDEELARASGIPQADLIPDGLADLLGAEGQAGAPAEDGRWDDGWETM